MRPLAPLVLAAVLATLPACSAESEEPSQDSSSESEAAEEAEELTPEEAATLLDEAVDTTLDVRSFTVESDLGLTIADQRLRLTVDGSIDYDDLVADIELAVEQQDQDQQIGLRSDGTTLWARVAGTGAPTLPGGAEWIEGDAQRLADSTTFIPSGVLGTVILLRGAQDVEVLGADEVDGVAVQRFATSLTYDEAAEAAGDDAGVLEDAFSLTGAATSVPIDIEVAVGEDGVVREMDFEIDGGDVPVSGGYDLELDDVAEDVDAPSQPEDVLTGPQADALLDQLVT